MVSNKELAISYINTKEQAADIFTKFLDKGTHDKACGLLNLSRQEEISVSNAIFAFRCEIDEDRVTDQEKE